MIDDSLRACRICSGRLDTILHLGDLALSTFPAPGDPPLVKMPLDLCACALCRTVQLRHTADRDRLYRHYWYRSGVNEVMQRELADVVQAARNRVQITPEDFVVDVGANDGTLLACYPKGTTRVAYEPALNLQTALATHAEIRIADYFPPKIFDHKGLFGKVKILTSIACFYGSDHPHAFVDHVRALLHPDGVWVVQFQDLHQMIAANAFDNICHEHLLYYSLASFERLIHAHGLVVTEAEVRKINGGSYRLYVQHAAQEASQRHLISLAEVRKIREWEAGCESWETLERFAWNVTEARQHINAVVSSLLEQGKTIDLYAASTKANTLLQYCGLGGDEIRQAWERSPEKCGRTTVTGIPIVEERVGRQRPPDALFIGAWQFRDAFIARETDYLEQGGSMLLPLPHCEIVVGGGYSDATGHR